MEKPFSSNEVGTLFLIGLIILIADIWAAGWALSIWDDWRKGPTLITAIIIGLLAVSLIFVPSYANQAAEDEL